MAASFLPTLLWQMQMQQTFNHHLLSPSAQQQTSSARKSLAKATPSLSGFVILQAMSGKTADFEHHNVFFPENYDDEFDSVFGIGKKPSPVADPTIYICSPNDAIDDTSWKRILVYVD